MSFSVEQAFVGRDEQRAPLKTPAWEAKHAWAFSEAAKKISKITYLASRLRALECSNEN